MSSDQLAEENSNEFFGLRSLRQILCGRFMIWSDVIIRDNEAKQIKFLVQSLPVQQYAFIRGKYKICIPDLGKEMMLFDLHADNTESNNLANEKPEVFASMKAGLEKVKTSWKQSREGKDYQW